MTANSPTPATTEMLPNLPASAALRDIKPARILVVDDQAVNIQMVGMVLGKLGLEIIPASDAQTALKRAALRTPDLILLDMLMPGTGGCELCRQIKANPAWRDIPVIFLSAADDKDLIVRALDVGGVDYITKPFNQAELVSRVRTQLVLKTTSDRLKQLAEDKDEMVGILTHDLKNHLAGINMSAELLHDRILRFKDERLTLLSENIFRSSSLSLSFLKEFLANSAAEHGLELKPAAINLADIAKTVISHYQESATHKKLEFHCCFPPEAVTVFADALALDQVLDNLISNAIKFSPSGKVIFVAVQVAGDHGECAIRDQGPGFTAEDKTRMFRRYSRLSARPTGGEPSTGLGLSIVHKLVLAMGGGLTCESLPQNGATFTISLPRANPIPTTQK